MTDTHLLMVILALLVAWAIALATYLPTLRITAKDTEAQCESEDYDDAA